MSQNRHPNCRECIIVDALKYRALAFETAERIANNSGFVDRATTMRDHAARINSIADWLDTPHRYQGEIHTPDAVKVCTTDGDWVITLRNREVV